MYCTWHRSLAIHRQSASTDHSPLPYLYAALDDTVAPLLPHTQEYIALIGSEQAGQRPLNSSEQWEVCVGSLLNAMHSGTSVEVMQGLEHTRQDIMAILPALSMESYVRAYPSIVRLHMLQVRLRRWLVLWGRSTERQSCMA